MSRRPNHQGNEIQEYNNCALLDKSVFICNIRTFLTNKIDDEIFSDQKSSDFYIKGLETGFNNDWKLRNEVLLYKRRIWVHSKELRTKLLEIYHNSLSGGHNGYKKII